MKLRLPNKLVAAIMAAASPVLFQTLSTATVGAAAVAMVGQQSLGTVESVDASSVTVGGTTYTPSQGKHIYVLQSGKDTLSSVSPAEYTVFSDSASHNSRYQITGANVLTDAGTLIISAAEYTPVGSSDSTSVGAGQLWISTDMSFDNNLILGASTYSETNYDGAMRIEGAVSFSGSVTLVADTKFTLRSADRSVNLTFDQCINGAGKTLTLNGRDRNTRNNYSTELTLNNGATLGGLSVSETIVNVNGGTLSTGSLSFDSNSNNYSKLTIAQNAELKITTAYNGGNVNLSKITGAGTLSLKESHGIASAAGNYANVTLSSDFSGTLHYQGGLRYDSNLGGADKVVFGGESNICFNSSAAGTHTFSKNIELEDDAILGISTWGNSSLTSDNRLTGAIKGGSSTIIRKKDGGAITLTGDLREFHGTFEMLEGNYGFVIDVAETSSNSTDATFKGSLNLIKTGRGALILSGGNNTYTSATTIKDGALIAANSEAFARSSHISFADLTAEQSPHRVLAFATDATYDSETGSLTGTRINSTIGGLSGYRGTVVADTLTINVAEGGNYQFWHRYDASDTTTDAAVLDVNKLIKTGAGTQVIGGEYTAERGFADGLVITKGIEVQQGTLHLKTRGTVKSDITVSAGATLKTTDNTDECPTADAAMLYDGQITLNGTAESTATLYYADGSTYIANGLKVNGYGTAIAQWGKTQYIGGLYSEGAAPAVLTLNRENKNDRENAYPRSVVVNKAGNFTGTIKLENGANADAFGLILQGSAAAEGALANAVIDVTGGRNKALLAFVSTTSTNRPGAETQINDFNTYKSDYLTAENLLNGTVAGLTGNNGDIYAKNLTINTAADTSYTYGGTLNVTGVTKTGSGSQSLNSTSDQSLGAVSVTGGALKIATNATATTLSVSGGTLDIAAEKRFALTTTTSGDKDYSGVTGSGTFAVALQSGGASIVSKLTLGSSFGGTLEVSGNLNSLSTLGGTANVQFNNGSALVFAHTKGRNDETLVGGVDDFSKAINIADGATFTIHTWGNNSNTNDNRISGAITGAASTTLQKGDTGKLTLNGDLSNFKGTLNASNGTLVIGNVPENGYSLKAISLNGGKVELAGGIYTIGGDTNEHGLFTGNGKLTLKNGAQVTLNEHYRTNADWQFEMQGGTDKGVTIESGSSFTVDSLHANDTEHTNDYNLKVSAHGSADATLTASGTMGYNFGTTEITIANADVEFTKRVNGGNFANQLKNSSFTNKGTTDIALTNGENTLTAVHAENGNITVQHVADHSAGTLTSVKAAGGVNEDGSVDLSSGGNVTLQDLTAETGLSLNELVIGNSKTVSALTDGSNAVNAQESNVAAISIVADGKLTAGVGATLNANLTMQSGSTLDVQQGGLSLGCSLTLNNGENFVLHGASMTDDGYLNNYTLYTGVDEFFMPGSTIPLASGWYNADSIINSITAYSSVDNSEPLDLNGNSHYVIGFWHGTVSIAEVHVPEPTTATLSLLALAGLAARRRRK